MSHKMSINDYINILDYNHVTIPKNIHLIKKVAIKLMDNKMCKVYCKDKCKMKNVRRIINRMKFKSNNKYYTNRTMKSRPKYVLNIKTTRNISPLSFLFIQIF